MIPQTLDSRVESLEFRVTILEQLPARVDVLGVQISQLHEEMRAEFSAVRTELRAGDDALGLQMSQLREEMHAEFFAVRTEMRAGDEAIMTQARVLHEDMKTTLALTAEGRPVQPPRRRPK